MFLKSLTLKGFKSFAEATTLEFEPGITVVVGPNGSGKSNVVDAVAWVLGAQGPRTVRSSKMEDVIFAGTASRPPLGRAEVELTIDNSAGLLDIGFSEVTITRTLFRSGDSEYAINGVPCRLLDIQELLSDTGVGRQQHVIVSQGQLDAVLNSRAEDRRLIIEEAAGVLKYRRRREKAQRRLEATEGNLLRLQDLLREVRRQLRPLERQADAARRHGALTAELGGIRLHLAGREISGLRSRSEHAARARVDLDRDRTELVSTLAELDGAVVAAESELSARGADDLSDDLLRFESLKEKARGLAALLAERRRFIDRDRAAFTDRALIASLEADAARFGAELNEVTSELDSLAPALVALADRDREVEEARASHARRWGAGSARPSTDAARVRGELSALRGAVEQGALELERVERALAALGEKRDRLQREADRLEQEITAAEGRQSEIGATAAQARAELAAAEAAAADAEALAREADGEWHSWTARAEALALALDEARARAGAERLASLDGIVGTLLDVVDIDEGWEAAFEAAAGEAIAAVVVADRGVATTALETLRAGNVSGAVLALGLDPAVVPAQVPGSRVRDHVRAEREDVERLLDSLLASAVVANDAGHAIELAVANPALVVVTRDGDRFASTGWRTGATATRATGAALDEARANLEAAGTRRAAALAAAASAGRTLQQARDAEAAAAKAVDTEAVRRSAAVATRDRIESDRNDAAGEEDALRLHVEEVAARLGAERDRIAELDSVLPGLAAEEEAAVAEEAAAQQEREQLDARSAAAAAERTTLEVRSAALDERRRFLEARLGEIGARLERDQAQRAEAEEGRTRLDGLEIVTDRLIAVVESRVGQLQEALDALRERRRQQSEAVRAISTRLDGLRRRRVDAERQLGEVRERLQRNEIDEAEIRMRLEAAVETVRRDFDCEPDAAIAAPLPEIPDGASPAARARELERELRLMGPINPLALEEHTALLERHTFLEGQLDDVKATRRDLTKVIRAIDAEIVEVFAAAYADVAANFTDLFTTLFPGGTGKLRLTDPDNLLDTGIEVEARPSGKNVRQLSLLSGGERSLTALAFLFAVFRSRPSPFYLMDEVEAALDDVNLHRFLELIDEFRREAQLVIVSHQKRTMEAADCLYGVTMQPGGSSKVVSERVAAGA